MDEIHRCVLRNCRMDLLRDISQVGVILDYLHRHGVFTPSMVADIQAERTVRDRARKMIDDLTRRGPQAWEIFLAGLRVEDVGYSHLADRLEVEETRLRPLPLPYPTVSDPSAPWQRNVGALPPSGTLQGRPLVQPCDQPQVLNYPVPESGPQLSITQRGECLPSAPMDITEELTAYQRQDPSKRYRMESEPRGYCLIINNIDFIGRPDLTRKGAQKDQHALTQLFAHKLGFKVEIRANLKAQEMLTTLGDFSKLDIHGEADSCVVAILTHGTKNEILHGTDMESVSITSVKEFFNSSTCHLLRGKPKLFLIQACRGTADGASSRTSEQQDHSSDGAGDVDLAGRIPSQADMLLAFSTTEGNVAIRHTEDGSWFIQHFVKEFAAGCHDTSVTELLIRVNCEVHKHHIQSNTPHVQIPAPVLMLTKTWFLNPPS